MKSRIPALIFAAIVVFAIGLAASGFDPREFARVFPKQVEHVGVRYLDAAFRKDPAGFTRDFPQLMEKLSPAKPEWESGAEGRPSLLRVTHPVIQSALARTAAIILFASVLHARLAFYLPSAAYDSEPKGLLDSWRSTRTMSYRPGRSPSGAIYRCRC